MRGTTAKRLREAARAIAPTSGDGEVAGSVETVETRVGKSTYARVPDGGFRIWVGGKRFYKNMKRAWILGKQTGGYNG